MFVIESCQKIEYNALFMMLSIPVSNFGDQPLEQFFLTVGQNNFGNKIPFFIIEKEWNRFSAVVPFYA